MATLTIAFVAPPDHNTPIPASGWSQNAGLFWVSSGTDERFARVRVDQFEIAVNPIDDGSAIAVNVGDVEEVLSYPLGSVVAAARWSEWLSAKHGTL